MNTGDIKYIAGLLEGEGYFEFFNTPRIALNMTDEDIVIKIKNLMSPDSPIILNKDDRPNRKPLYRFQFYGNSAIQWMMTLYPLMGIRRKERIRNIIQEWKDENLAKGINILAKCKNISYLEARNLIYN